MKWKFWQRETREADYTATLISALLGAAAEGAAAHTALGALEAAAGFYGTAAAAADVDGGRGVVTRQFRHLVLRDLVRRGNSVWLLEVQGGRLHVLPVRSWDVNGGPDPESWTYRLDVAGPSVQVTRVRPAAGVLHFVWSPDSVRPWAGVSPLAACPATAGLAAGIERQLSNEANAPTGYLLPVPQEPQGNAPDGRLATLTGLLKDLKGRAGLVETVAGGWNQGPDAKPQRDWKQSRFGMDPPAQLAELRTQLCATIYEACGLGALLSSTTDGTLARENYRRWAHACLKPRLELIGDELAAKLDAPVRFDLTDLWASDWLGRVNAVRNLARAEGMADRAAALADRLGLEAA